VQVSSLDPGPRPDGPAATSVARSSDGRQGLVLAVEGADAEVEAGGEHTVVVRVRNTGTIVERVDFRVEGAPGRWATVEPSQVNIDQGDEQAAMVRFAPPREPSTAAGPAVYEIHAWSLSNPTVRVTEGGRLVVRPFATASVSVDALVAESRRAGDYVVTVANQGNVPMEAQIQPTDGGHRLRLHPAREFIDLPAGQATTVGLDVRPRRRLWTGPAQVHHFTVAVHPRGGASITADAVLTQKPLLPRWAPKAAATAVVLAALVGVLPVRNWLATRPRPVPSAVGRTADDARAALTEEGFKPETRQAPSDRAAGEVFEQRPAPGQEAAGGSSVVLVVSQGPAPIPVPKVAGLTREQAERQLTALGLRAQVTEQASSDVAKGEVISQRPADGEKVQKGQAVDLVVSAGPETVVVPSLANKSRSEALADLAGKGLEATVVLRTREDLAPGTVFDQEPKAGSRIEKGRTVQVFVTPEALPTTVPAPTLPPPP
jgi:beta-lactam-binding protein with PASTA domain